MAYKNMKTNKARIKWLRSKGGTLPARNKINIPKENSFCLIITWKRPSVTFPPYVESFFTKSDDSAKRIIDRRQKENMVSAIFQGRDILNMK